MKIERIDISAATPDPANVRRHDDKNLAAIKGSLVKFGQMTPIVLDRRGVVLKGNGTLAAAKALGWETIDVVYTDLTGVDAVGYSVADNRSGELAAWDDAALAKTLAALKADGFALDMIGFDDRDLERWIDAPSPPVVDPVEHEEDEPDIVVPEVQKRAALGQVWQLGRHRIACGDSGDPAVVATLMAGEMGHALVSDPPYGLSFMGKAWDKAVPQTPLWKVWVDVLRPGAHILMFSGTRTYHRATVQLEDAGVEVRDQMQWLHGQGFPKSHNISAAIDRESGDERPVIGQHPNPARSIYSQGAVDMPSDVPLTAAASAASAAWDGFGTALKPANEPICVARKPLEGTVAECVQKHGTGALNIDSSRIGTETVATNHTTKADGSGAGWHPVATGEKTEHVGRWPANVILSHTPDCGDECTPDCPVRMLEEQSGYLHGAGNKERGGYASRFFYCAKPARSERGDGNTHATVKPLRLMEYLVKLVTADGQTVLEPFCGSGTTLLACETTGRTCLAAELDPGHCDIVLARWEKLSGKTAVLA